MPNKLQKTFQFIPLHIKTYIFEKYPIKISFWGSELRLSVPATIQQNKKSCLIKSFGCTKWQMTYEETNTLWSTVTWTRVVFHNWACNCIFHQNQWKVMREYFIDISPNTQIPKTGIRKYIVLALLCLVQAQGPPCGK